MATVDEPIPPTQAGWISQTGQARIVVPGCLTRVVDGRAVPGSRCTLTFLRVDAGWVVYRHGIEEDPVLISTEDAQRLAEGLRGDES